jgi:hypothetical protein
VKEIFTFFHMMGSGYADCSFGSVKASRLALRRPRSCPSCESRLVSSAYVTYGWLRKDRVVDLLWIVTRLTYGDC